MIDESEKLISRSEAIRYLQSIHPDGKRPAPSSFDRWRSKGISGVVLETVLVSGTICTTREAIHRFIAASATAKTQRVSRATSEGMRRAKLERAKAEAADMGLV